jgi:hypothetical protein
MISVAKLPPCVTPFSSLIARLSRRAGYRTGEKTAGMSTLFSCRIGRTPGVAAAHRGWRDAPRMQARSLAEADPRMTLAHAAPDHAHRGHQISMVCEKPSAPHGPRTGRRQRWTCWNLSPRERRSKNRAPRPSSRTARRRGRAACDPCTGCRRKPPRMPSAVSVPHHQW